MKNLFLLLVLVLLILVSCGGNSTEGKKWMEAEGKIHVVSTTAMIDDLVKDVGGERVATYTLIDRGLDPHSYQLVKGDDEKLSRADLIFYNGLGLEHGASLYYYLTHHTKAVSLGGEILKNSPDRILHVGNQVDPHIWMDASLFSQAIPFIVQSLSEKDPEHAALYQENGQKKMEAMQKLHDSIKNLLSLVPNERRYMVTSHDAFNYFTRAYLAGPHEDEKIWSERFKAPEGLAPDSQISSADIQDILDHVIRYRISVIFPESNVSQDSIKKLVSSSRERGVVLSISKEPLFGDSMGKKGSAGDTYDKMLLHNAAVLKQAWNSF